MRVATHSVTTTRLGKVLWLCRWAFVTLLCAGCFSANKRKDMGTGTPDRHVFASDVYALACPDVIEVIFASRPYESHRASIGADGCIQLGAFGSIRVEGDTAAEAAARIAERIDCPPRQVLVQVAEFKSREVFLIGEVHGEPRAVDYRGPETVVELLRRTGGLSPDAAPNQVYVVRAQLGEGIPAEVLTVDLDAIQRKNDHRTNVRLQPLDQIYVGETTRSRISKALPGFLRPVYEAMVGLFPNRGSKPPSDDVKPAK